MEINAVRQEISQVKGEINSKFESVQQKQLEMKEELKGEMNSKLDQMLEILKQLKDK